MSNYPNDFDTDATLPIINNNITEIGGEAVNAQRDAIFNMQQAFGINPQGSAPNLAAFLNVSFLPDGTIKPSALTSLGLIVLPITNDQISATAAIEETKLALDYKTSDLYNLIINQNIGLNTSLNFINFTGSKVNPHINGTSFKHILNHINVSTSTNDYLKNQFNLDRDNTNAYTVLSDLNTDFVNHQKKDGTGIGVNFTTVGGTTLSSNFSHTASSVFVNPSNFTFIPKSVNDLQAFVDFINNTNILLLGSRTQTLFSNGISKTARSTPFGVSSSVGQLIVPLTAGTAYLLDNGSSSPVDNISTGDDILEFTPQVSLLVNNVFDSYFSEIKVGDIATIDYSDVIVSATIKEFRAVVDDVNKKFIIRINSKNIRESSVNITINRPAFNTNKYGVLATGVANNEFNELPSLIVADPRSAQTLGINFNADHIDNTHYNLYLQYFPYNDPAKQTITLAAIDISGNNGSTPGAYTLNSVVQATNNSFRKNGFNNRFIAFNNNGQFGIALADVYNNAAFSIIEGTVDGYGQYDVSASLSNYPNNVIGLDDKDALGFGLKNSNSASPPYASIFNSPQQANNKTKIFIPLTKNNYYVNGTEKDKLNFLTEIDNNILPIDGYGISYYPATIFSKQVFPGARIELTYKVNLNLSTLNIKPGKTLVAQPNKFDLSYTNYGRFTIKEISFDNCNCDGYSATTYITVYDAVANIGISPYVSNSIGTEVRLYITDDSISFNDQNANDNIILSNFKRSFEVYVDSNGHTFTYERARFNSSGSATVINSNPNVVLNSNPEISFFNIVNVSPKFKGFDFSGFNKITLHINNYDSNAGIFDGYLCKFDTVITNISKLVSGKKGEVVRFYNETNIDYIDLTLNMNDIINSFSNQNLDIQLYPSLQQNAEYFLLSTVQLDNNNNLNYLIDKRQFGNVSEENLTNSALDYISATDRLLHKNTVVKGFDLVGSPINEKVNITGGTAIVNGKIININNNTISIPVVREIYNSTEYQKTLWAICVNYIGDFEAILLNDIDVSSPSTAPVVQRVITLLDPKSVSTYKMFSKTFEELVNSNNSFTPLYIVTAVTTGTFPSTVSTTITLKDVRKFGYHIDADVDLSLTELNSNRTSSFTTFTAIENYINLNPNNYFDVKVKGAITAQSISTSNISFNNGGNGTINVISPVSFENVILNNLTLNLSSTLTLGANVLINNCTFNITSKKGIILNGTKIKLNKNIFNYSYDATSDVDFSATNLVNHKAAAIFSTNTGIQATEIEINDNKFITTQLNRFPFISFIAENTFTSTPSNIKITNNIFNSVSTRSDIAFICENTTDELILNSINISNNNSNQGIYVISALNTSFPYTNLGFICKSVKIENNTVPTIGFLTKASTSVPNDAINIKGNVCTYISNLNHNGQYIPFTFDSINSVVGSNNTGSYTVDSNFVTWIHLGSYAKNYLLNNKIINNNLCIATLNTYLSNFTNTDYTLTPDNEAIILRRGDITIDFANTLVDSNSIYSKSTFRYASGITIQSNVHVTNNTLNKCISGANADMVYIGFVTKATITQNHFIRDTDIINSYIEGLGTSVITNSNVFITENIFDSSTIDGTNEQTVQNIPLNWICERNTNQIGFTTIPMHSFNIGTIRNGGYVDSNIVSSDAGIFIGGISTGSPSGLPYGDIKNTFQLINYDPFSFNSNAVNQNDSVKFRNAFTQDQNSDRTTISEVWNRTPNQYSQFLWLDVSNNLPQNVKIVGVKYTLAANPGSGGIDTGGTNLLTVELGYQSNFPTGSSYSTITGSVLDSTTTSAPYNSIGTGVNMTTYSSGINNIVELTESSLEPLNIFAAKDKTILARVKIILKQTTNNLQTFVISPLVIKYRW